jgi:hypothetical protein
MVKLRKGQGSHLVPFLIKLYKMAAPDLYHMVLNRLSFLPDTPETEQLVNDYFYEVAWEMEPCFRIAVLPDGTIDESRVAVEANYSVAQLSICADLIAVYILMQVSAFNASGGADADTGATATLSFLSRAKAGSAEAEWTQLDTSKAEVLALDADKIISMYQQSAARKARNMGCIIDICTDCFGPNGVMLSGPLPLVTVTGCGCGCGGGYYDYGVKYGKG